MSRSYFDVAFDTTRGKIIMVGGYYGSVYNTDIWEWDTTDGRVGAADAGRGASTVPDGRYYHAVAYDSIRRADAAGRRARAASPGERGRPTIRGSGTRTCWRWNETTPTGVKPLPREQHLMVFNPMRGTTYLFGGTVPEDTTYGPSEFWEYLPERDGAAERRRLHAPRRRRAACRATASTASAARRPPPQCNGTCKSCNVAGHGRDVQQRPRRPARRHLSVATRPATPTQTCKKRLGQACTMFSRVRERQLRDGVCCDTACNGTCKQCNLAGKRGHLLVRADRARKIRWATPACRTT